jgi:pimeloyl-ACP methyl ester carboxylesterase
MSTPHSGAFLDAMKNDPLNLQKAITYLNLQNLICLRLLWLPMIMQDLEVIGGFPQEIIDDYLTIFSVKEARTATVNYYRGLFLPADDRTNPSVPYGDMYIPILYLFGVDDIANARAGVDATHKFIKGPYTFVQLKAGHWLMQFNEDECSKEIVEHILKYTKN